MSSLAELCTIPFTKAQKSDDVIAEVTCVIHPEGVPTVDHIGNLRDDIPIGALERFDIVGKPVTEDHGELGHAGWKRQPTVAGEVMGTKMDEHGRLLGYFVLYDTKEGRRAHNQIVRRDIMDVSPMFFQEPLKSLKGDADAYTCNHLALCKRGRRGGTHILAMKSRMPIPQDIMIKHPSIRDKNPTTSRASRILFEGTNGPAGFFTGTHCLAVERRNPKYDLFILSEVDVMFKEVKCYLYEESIFLVSVVCGIFVFVY